MPIRDLAEVGARLLETAHALDDDHDLYERLEMLAFATLDGEHADFPPDALEAYLATFLEEQRRELLFNPSGETP